MPPSPRAGADPDQIHPGDIVWLDARHLAPTRGAGHTWPHLAVCLYHYHNKAVLPDLILSGTIFQFVCISSITRSRPFDPTRQVRLDHTDPNTGLTAPSAACVDFAPSIVVTIAANQLVLEGVRRLTSPGVRRVSDSPTLQAIQALFNAYWSSAATGGT